MTLTENRSGYFASLNYAAKAPKVFDHTLSGQFRITRPNGVENWFMLLLDELPVIDIQNILEVEGAKTFQEIKYHILKDWIARRPRNRLMYFQVIVS